MAWLKVGLAAALLGVAATHLLAARTEDAGYMVALFLLASWGAMWLACTISWPWQWITWAALALCVVLIGGYVASRLVAFPQMADDVGNWLSPVGLCALASETAGIGLSVALLARRPRV